MNDLLAIIAKLGIELHPDRVDILASKIQKIESVEYFTLSKSSLGYSGNSAMLSQFSAAWKNNSKVSPIEIAAALRSASATAKENEKRGKTEIVWTGPTTDSMPVRHTEQVLCEVINSAERELFIVSFVAYEIESVTKALRNAIGRNVLLSFLLELPYEQGGKVGQDSIKMMKRLFPSANIYSWAANLKTDPKYFKGAIHAKCAVADGALAFITSANLTVAAMDRNIELGILIKGGKVPLELNKHLNSLVLTEIFEKVMD